LEKITLESSPRFLVIEDEQAQRNLLREILRREGYECECASTCAEGRDLFSKGKYACALIDLGLPDGNGLALLSDFSSEDPCTVLVILTGETSPETIIDTMRGGAFDYLRKPVDLMTFRAAISRALAHHSVAMERAELFRLLVEEREQLRARVEAATADIRQYASACEVSNSRLRALLRLAQMSTEYYTDEHLFRQVFTELARHLPLRGLALCNASRRKLLFAVLPEGALEVEFLGSESMSLTGYDTVLAEADPGLLVREMTVRFGGIDVDQLDILNYPQVSSAGTTSTVAFMLSKGREPDVSDSEFLDTCAYFLAFEWERGQLLYHVAHHASLGNIAVELARNFIQPLTAIQTAVDFVAETIDNSEAEQGLYIIAENADRLRRQTQEFRKLSTLRENAIETVTLADYVEQALDMLTVAIQNRGVTIKKEFQSECECVLLNGTTLARTILDVVLGSLRSVEMGGAIMLRLQETEDQHVAFEVVYHAVGRSAATTSAEDFIGATAVNPVLQLAERTVHACGGSLSVEILENQRTTVRIQLPRNATNPARRWEPVS
jgi:DNA-binding response OmpR family regulator